MESCALSCCLRPGYAYKGETGCQWSRSKLVNSKFINIVGCHGTLNADPHRKPLSNWIRLFNRGARSEFDNAVFWKGGVTFSICRFSFVEGIENVCVRCYSSVNCLVAWRLEFPIVMYGRKVFSVQGRTKQQPFHIRNLFLTRLYWFSASCSSSTSRRLSRFDTAELVAMLSSIPETDSCILFSSCNRKASVD